jgi:glucose-1-phosphate thymidylyltransferase
MLYYPIQTLVDAGLREIMIVTGGDSAGAFLKLLRNGKDFGLQQVSFAYQEGEGGIADALRLTEHFAAGDKICVILGDNIIEGSIRESALRFEEQPCGARILLKEVPDPERFGVPVFDQNGHGSWPEGLNISDSELALGPILRIEEKPRDPKSRFAVIGIYFYDATVFDRIRTLRPSARGEYEITDINNSYLTDGSLRYDILEGWWTDAGTFESLFRASHLVRRKIGLPGEEAWETWTRGHGNAAAGKGSAR